MANLCSNYVAVIGNKKSISKLTKEIKNQDKKLLEIFPWFEFSDYDYGLWEDCFIPLEKHITLSFGSKWSFPFQEFKNLATNYPDLIFNARYEEPGMEIFGTVHAHAGEFDTTEMEPLKYYSEYNGAFAEELDCIETLPYDEFLKYVEKFDEDEDFTFMYLTPLIIERIKKEDLPLFIDKFSHNKLFTEKLKGE